MASNIYGNHFSQVPLGFQFGILLSGLILHRSKDNSYRCFGVLSGKRNLKEHDFKYKGIW